MHVMIIIHFWRRCCYLLEERALAVPSSSTLRLADCSDHDLENKHRLVFFLQKQGQQFSNLTNTHHNASKLTTLTTAIHHALHRNPAPHSLGHQPGQRWSKNHQHTPLKQSKLTLLKVKPPSVPSADPFIPGLQLGTLDCNGTAAPVEKTAAYDIVHRFCNEHQGVNIAHGDNFSTSYDTVNATRLHFNVINECAPNGVYLPLDTCLSGFTRVAKCSADCGFAWTAGGQTTMDCMAFDISMEANATPVVGEQGDGVVVSCEGLC